jgi:hypothetical protein
MRVGDSVPRGGKRADVRRGRISMAEYEAVVGRMLTRDWFALDHCDVLAQLDIVNSLINRYPARFLSKGAAVRWLLDKAIDQVIAACEASADAGSLRVAQFLQQRQAGASVAAIAREWGISREYVSRTIGRRAVQLVTKRVLALGRRTLVVHDPGDASEMIRPVDHTKSA